MKNTEKNKNNRITQTIDFKETVITNFSGIYKNQNFYKNYAEEEISWTELSDLSGCNCYCDAEASDRIRKEIQAFTGKGLHFIDSGNYHYMTRLWLEKLQIPFRLLVFDNQSSSTVVRVGRVNLDQIGTLGARYDRELVFSHALCFVEASGFDGEGEIGDGVVAGERMGFLDGVGAGIEALDVNLAGVGGRELIRVLIEGAIILDIHVLGCSIVGISGTDGELYAGKFLSLISRVLLDEPERIGVVAHGVGHRLTLGLVARVVGVDELDAVVVARVTDNNMLGLLWVELGAVRDNDPCVLVDRDIGRLGGSLKIFKLYTQERLAF